MSAGRVKASALAAAVMLLGCAPPAKLSEVEREVWKASCIFSSCHQGVGASGLSLEGKTYAKLVNVDAKDARGRKLIVTKDLQASYLYEKLTTNAPQTGTRMPQGAVIDQQALEMVKSWIENGAQDD